MIEKHDIESGPVYNDCLCAAGQPLPQDPVILKPECYSPEGTDCDWYRQCLHKMYDCTGQAEYAISYGEKFCKLYELSTLQFSQKALQWINATRKCLQVELVPLLHLCQLQPTCEDIRKTAFGSHVPCYLEPYKGISVCLLYPLDWVRIFWTIKSSFVSSAFVETVKASVLVIANCPRYWVKELRNYLYSIVVRVLELSIEKRATTGVLSDDELAHAIVLQISSSLHWDQQSTMDWYAFAVNTSAVQNSLTTPADQPGRELKIQVIGLSSSECLSVCRFVSVAFGYCT